MPSSAVQMEARSPVSLLNRAVKRKSDDDVVEGASGERELNQKVRVLCGKHGCAVRDVKPQLWMYVWLCQDLSVLSCHTVHMFSGKYSRQYKAALQWLGSSVVRWRALEHPVLLEFKRYTKCMQLYCYALFLFLYIFALQFERLLVRRDFK